MNKNFKITAIAIIAFGALLFMKERKEVNAQKEMSKKYDDERAAAQKKSADKFAAVADNIQTNETGINKCLAKVKPVELTAQDEAGILLASIKAIGDGKKDSAERVNGGDKAVLNKLNKQNTLIIYFNKLDDKKLHLADNIKQLIEDNNSYSNKLSLSTDLDLQKKEEALSRAAGVQYIMVAQPEKIKRGKIVRSEQFDPGYMVIDYEIYNIATSEKVKTGTILATNSESLYTVSSTDPDIMIYNDLIRQGNLAVVERVFGITN